MVGVLGVLFNLQFAAFCIIIVGCGSYLVVYRFVLNVVGPPNKKDASKQPPPKNVVLTGRIRPGNGIGKAAAFRQQPGFDEENGSGPSWVDDDEGLEHGGASPVQSGGHRGDFRRRQQTGFSP